MTAFLSERRGVAGRGGGSGPRPATAIDGMRGSPADRELD